MYETVNQEKWAKMFLIFKPPLMIRISFWFCCLSSFNLHIVKNGNSQRNSCLNVLILNELNKIITYSLYFKQYFKPILHIPDHSLLKVKIAMVC